MYVLWPEEEEAGGEDPTSAQWYHARVDSYDGAKKRGTLFYDETEELEEGADLADLVAQGHLAFSELFCRVLDRPAAVRDGLRSTKDDRSAVEHLKKLPELRLNRAMALSKASMCVCVA